jgi:tetratricopeptide (TPR) repeat protein
MSDALRQQVAGLLALGQVPAARHALAQWHAQRPPSAESLHAEAMLAIAEGQLPLAAERLEQSLAASPHNPQAHYQLGRLLKDAGHPAEALACYDRAIALAPDFWQAHSSRGIAARQLGLTTEAIASQQRVAALRPQDPAAQLNLANALLTGNRLEESAAAYAKALQLRPDDPAAQRGLRATKALGLLAARRWGEAQAAFDEALGHEPASPTMLVGAGAASRRLGFEAQAAARFAQAEALTVTDAATCWTIGEFLIAVGACGPQAKCWVDRAAALLGDTAGPDVYAARASTRVNLGEFAEADGLLTQALATFPEAAHLQWVLALSRLWQDDYRTGFQGFETRFEVVYANGSADNNGRLPLAARRWTGEPLAGRHLMIWAEQGLGDTLQFIRFLPALIVAHPAARLTVLVQDALVSLLKASFPDDEICALSTLRAGTQADFEVALMSLPHVLEMAEQTQPLPFPYLQAGPAKIAEWRQRLGPRQRLRAGLVWAGNPTHLRDAERSIPLRWLAQLDHPDIEFHALQKGHGEEQMAALPDFPLRRTAAGFADFHDTAAALSQLDVVITVDTSVAHLAGAMGLPTCLLLHAQGEWRWGMSRETCRWYPSLRFFRQSVAGDWTEVMARVDVALRELLNQFTVGP